MVSTLLKLSEQAQMVVVGSREYSALRRGPFGSVTTAMVHHAHCPVVVIHHRGPSRVLRGQAPVLVGIDGSPDSQLGAAMAFEEATRRGVDLIALHACSDATTLASAGFNRTAMRTRGAQALAEQLAGWQERYPDVTVRPLIVDDRPTRSLLDECGNAQLVVVGGRGRGGTDGMLLGSVAAALVHRAQIPVVVVRRQHDSVRKHAETPTAA